MTHTTRGQGMWWTAAALLCATLAVSACGGSGGDDTPTPPPPDTTAPTLAATPDSGWSATPVAVTLTATDARDANPTVYYTLDLTVPTTASSVYTAPIDVGATTVIKAIAVDASNNTSDVYDFGYTIGGGPYTQAWTTSGHGEIAAEAWRHWDEDGTVPTTCAKCHSGDGFLDYAQDGTVGAAAPLPLGLACSGCHPAGAPNTAYDDLTTYPELEPVAFPSGAEVTLRDDDNVCLACHQGAASTVQVNDKIAAGPAPYSFTNVHYYAAAASYFGTEVRGGYEYAGLTYVPRNPFPSHPSTAQTCVGCHMREGAGATHDHTFKPLLADCTTCHSGTSFQTLSGSPGVNYTAIQGNLTQLYGRIRTYATTTIGTSIVYDGSAYPYWFVDTDNDGVHDASETTVYALFDARLLRAAYNYQFARNEPCGYIHNGSYVRQILCDSITDLGGTPTTAAPGRPGFTAASTLAGKTQQWHLSGHGATGGLPFRYWDTSANVSSSCAKCHTSPGFVQYATAAAVTAGYQGTASVGCIACHNDFNLFANDETRYDDLTANPALEPVTFPSTNTASLSDASNICMGCYQGLASTLQVDTKISAGPSPYTFTNVHYYAAAASYFGSVVQGGYQYSGKTYRGQNPFAAHTAIGQPVTCVECHLRSGAEDHGFVPLLSDCTTCHGIGAPTSFPQLSGSPKVNYNAIQTLLTELLPRIQTYATGTIGTSICYDAVYPYWFVDTNGNGVRDAGENTSYALFDAKLLRAAYNYQFARTEPCGYIHNGIYVQQLLHDSITDLGGTPSLPRP